VTGHGGGVTRLQAEGAVVGWLGCWVRAGDRLNING